MTDWLWRIKTIRWSGKNGKSSEEFVTAKTIEDVWNQYLKLDRNDTGVEIEAIIREVPILAHISSDNLLAETTGAEPATTETDGPA